MEIVKCKNGSLRYKEKVYLQNGRTQTKTFFNKTDAKKWKQDIESEKRRNPESFLKKNLELTFESTFNTWMVAKIKDKRSRKTELQYQLFYNKHFSKRFGYKFIHTITTQEIDSCVSKMLDNGLKPKSLNNVLMLLKQIFKYAMNEGIITKNPSLKVEFLKVPESDVKYFTDEEIRSLLDANKFETIYPVIVFALNTGARIGEIFGLCWDCINFEKNQILIRRNATRYGLQEQNKTSSIRHIPMNPTVKKLLHKLMRNQKSLKFVFPDKHGEMQCPDHFSSRVFKKATERASIRFLSVHCLRHSYASHFMMNNGNIYDLQKILGHRDLKTTMIYAHLSPQHLVEASKIINFEASNAVETSVDTKTENSPNIALVSF